MENKLFNNDKSHLQNKKGSQEKLTKDTGRHLQTPVQDSFSPDSLFVKYKLAAQDKIGTYTVFIYICI